VVRIDRGTYLTGHRECEDVVFGLGIGGYQVSKKKQGGEKNGVNE
jgi:hypothetical protein